MSVSRSLRNSSIAAAILIPLVVQSTAIGSDHTRLGGHVPHKKIAHSRHLGRLNARASINLAFALKPRDPEGLADFVKRVQDPADPQYGHFLTSAEFKDRFAPSDDDVNQVLAYLQSKGITRASVHSNNLVIDAVAGAETVESAFQVELHEYQTKDGRRVHAPINEPDVSEEIATRLHGMTGLSSFQHSRPHLKKNGATLNEVAPDGVSSINSYMTPPKIKSAYGLSTAATAGNGETLALFELDGFQSSDISKYANTFSITAPTINTILVDGASGSAGSDADEVSLDIELAMAASPGLSAINVYEGPNTDSGVLDTYSRIASDNSAKEVSTSWGAPEDTDTQSYLDAENTIFQQMAAQGQSVFAAAGDAGAYDDTENPGTLTVDDPASQPYVTAVGGTTLSLIGNGYGSETSWGTSSTSEGGGGGVSAVWSQPSWQSSLATVASKGSNTRRMVPDVALDANPNTGYSIYTGGAWYAIGGTSAAAPLWAAFMAQVNQARLNNSMSRIGFANTSIYQLAQSSLASSCFHDISDSSTNLHFPAVSGFDLSTGWGSFKGSALISALSATLPPAAPTNVATSGAAGTVTISWTASTNATSYSIYRSSSFSGPFVSIGSTAGTSTTDAVGANGYYYYVVATNASGSSGASLKHAGAAPLAAPGAASGLSSSEAP
ncbi:MAG: protease pro-enzyme activation domain-containing protein [Bdellovibrionota bacterium]